jgi:hypothetical protein
MISGTKISQLPVVTVLQDTDYFPIARGATTNRISGLILNSAALSTIKANFPISYTSGIFTLSSNNTILLQSDNIKLQTNLLTLTGSQVIEVNSLSAALRITQAGLGNALVVEDSANPDSTPFVITSSGNIGVGTSTPINKLHIHTTASSTGSGAHIKLTQTSNSNESYITTDSNGYTRIGGVAGIGLVASTNQVVSVLSSGKVGIGTTTPNESLTVSGNVSANTVYAYISGNSETATKWRTARNVNLNGSVYGNTSIDGTQDITIYTTISTGVITDNNIANSANISDTKLAQIVSVGKVSPAAIDYSGTQPNQVLTSTGSATIWQDLSSIQLTILSGTIVTAMINDLAVTTQKIADNAITSVKLTAECVTTPKIADSAITTSKILDGAVTLQKTVAYSAAIPDSLVSRDSSGNLSATEVTGALKGNASTANALQSPMILQLTGDALGQVSFDGSQNVVMDVTNSTLALPPVWAVYNATSYTNLTCSYIQGTKTTEGNLITVTVQEISGFRIKNGFYDFLQTNNIINITFSDLNNVSSTFLEYNLLTGTPLTATFTGVSAITGTYTPLPSGVYTINNVVINNPYTATITITSSISQFASGSTDISYIEQYFNLPHKLNEGHILNVAFLTGVPLGSGSYVAQPSGLYMVTNTPDSITTITLSTNSTQSVSGNLVLYFCNLYDSYKVSKVTYVDTGIHILNFETPFVSPYFYGFSGSVFLNAVLSGQPYMGSIQKDIRLDIQDQYNLGIRTVLNDGTLKFYDFYRNNVICFGSR